MLCQMIREGISKYFTLLSHEIVLMYHSPTIGTLVAMSPEELVIKPIELEKPATVDVRIHFPRVGCVARPYKEEAKL